MRSLNEHKILIEGLNVGDKLTHKYDKNISITLIEPTSKGWKVEQSTKSGKKVKTKSAFFDKQDLIGDRAIFESLNEGKLRLKGDYPVYHGTYSDTLDAISDYVVGSGYNIDDDEFFTAFGDAFFKPKKGKTLRKQVEVEDKEGNLLGHLNVQIYNRGTSGNTYELNMYVD